MYGEISLPRGLRLATALQRVSRSLYEFREEGGYVFQLLLVFGFAGLTGLSAQIVVPLPFTPVPITGQVFGVLLSSALLGRWLGPLTQGLYVGLGALGVPWFAPASSATPFTVGGLARLIGVTGGYLLGFVVAAVVVGWLVDRGDRERSFAMNLSVLLAGVAVIYIAGALQLAFLLRTSLNETLLYGVVPFVPGDILKAVLAATVLAGTLPSRADDLSDPIHRWARPLTTHEVLFAGGLVAVVWAIVPVLTFTVATSPEILVFYVIASSVSTVAIGLALGIRWSLTRAAREVLDAHRIRPDGSNRR